MVIIQELASKGLCHPPKWLPTNTKYLTIMGSVAYGASSDTSDMDVYGFCIPTKETVFPHLAGNILGFGTQVKKFDQWQEHHINDPSAMGGHGRQYDFTVYNIVRYFQLAMDNNPNIIDSIFTPINCVIHSSNVANIVRENRRIFLHKGAWPRFKGYAYSQIAKIKSSMDDKDVVNMLEFEKSLSVPHSTRLLDLLQEMGHRDLKPDNVNVVSGQGSCDHLSHLSDKDLLTYYDKFSTAVYGSRRFEMRKVNGYDVKFAYHVIRLLNEVEQILMEHDIDLQRNREELKAIRAGEWSPDYLRQVAAERERGLEELYKTSTLRSTPDEPAIKALLLEVLEEHYGNLNNCIINPDKAILALRNIQSELDKVSGLL